MMLQSDTKLLVIIVPAYNEEATIAQTVHALRAAAAGLASKGLDARIFVIDDGSTDNTLAGAKAAGADRIVRHRRNLGLGAAVRSGLRAAFESGAAIVVKFDADRQHDPNDITDLVQPILDDEADIVYGDRFQRIDYRMPLVRRWGNRAFTGLMRWLTGWPLRDSQPGIIALDRSYLSVFQIPGDYNYTQQILLEAYLKGLRFAHCPVSFTQRTKGKSFISFKYPLKVLPQILMVFCVARPLKVFAPIGLCFLALGGGVFAWQLGNYLLGHSEKPVENVNLVLGSILFGLQTLFFGVLAQLLVITRR